MYEKPKLLDLVRRSLRQRNYSYSTEKTYTSWIKRHIVFHKMRHPLRCNGLHIPVLYTLIVISRIGGVKMNIWGQIVNTMSLGLFFLSQAFGGSTGLVIVTLLCIIRLEYPRLEIVYSHKSHLCIQYSSRTT